LCNACALTPAQPAISAQVCPAWRSRPDLVALAEVGHVAEGADAGKGQLRVVFEAERTVGVAGC
jgi:hypothetical protein